MEPVGENENSDRYWFIPLLMDEILNPWIEGGQNRDKKIAEGIESIWKFGGAEDLYENACMLLEAYGQYIKDCIPSSEDLKNDMDSILTRFKIHEAIRSYEDSIETLRPQEKNQKKAA